MDKVLYSGKVVKSDMINCTGMPITEREFRPHNGIIPSTMP